MNYTENEKISKRLNINRIYWMSILILLFLDFIVKIIDCNINNI